MMFWITGILGLVLVLSPFALGFTDQGTALWTYVFLGVIVVIASMLGQFWTQITKSWLFWVNGVAGVVVFIAPFIFGGGVGTPQQWIGLVVGTALVVVSALALYQQQLTPRPQSR